MPCKHEQNRYYRGTNRYYSAVQLSSNLKVRRALLQLLFWHLTTQRAYTEGWLELMVCQGNEGNRLQEF